MLLIKFLNENADWYDKLKSAPYNLMIQNDGDFWLFKYSQISSDMTLQICQECRGIILRKTDNDWTVVCHPFNKFFNLGETKAYPIDFSKVKIFEKVDGSILKVYWNDNEWIVATNGTINSKNSDTRILSHSFHDVFMEVVGVDGFEKMKSAMHKNITYLFELIHPITRIVVDYGELKELVYLGYRYNSGEWFENDYLPDYIFHECEFIRLPKLFDVNMSNFTAEGLESLADAYNQRGVDFEGFVAAELDGYKVTGRVKIKSPRYLKFHHLAGGSIYNAIMQLVMDNEVDEFKAYLSRLPYYVNEIFNETKSKYDIFIKEVNEYVDKYRELSKTLSRKDLAFDVQDNVPGKYRYFIFGLIYGNKDIPTIIAKMPVRDVRKMIGVNVILSEESIE